MVFIRVLFDYFCNLGNMSTTLSHHVKASRHRTYGTKVAPNYLGDPDEMPYYRRFVENDTGNG